MVDDTDIKNAEFQARQFARHEEVQEEKKEKFIQESTQLSENRIEEEKGNLVKGLEIDEETQSKIEGAFKYKGGNLNDAIDIIDELEEKYSNKDLKEIARKAEEAALMLQGDPSPELRKRLLEDLAEFKNIGRIRKLEKIYDNALKLDKIDDTLPPFLIEGLVYRYTHTGITGYGGLGKSRLGIQLAAGLALGNGEDFLGPGFPKVYPIEGEKVIYFSWEDSIAQILHRLYLHPSCSNVSDYNNARNNLKRKLSGKLIPMEMSGMGALWQPGGRDGADSRLSGMLTDLFDAIRKICRKSGINTVILDTMGSAFRGNENDRAEAEAFMKALSGWAIESNITIITIAHSSKSSQVSGNTAIFGSFRSVFNLRMQDIINDNGEQENMALFEAIKGNYSKRKMSERMPLWFLKEKSQTCYWLEAIKLDNADLSSMTRGLEAKKKGTSSQASQDAINNAKETYERAVKSGGYGLEEEYDHAADIPF